MKAAVNLTEAQARRRAELIRVESYDIAVALAGGLSTFTTTTTVGFECRRPGTGTFIECAAESLDSATLNGVPLDLGAWSAERGLALPDLASENVLIVTGTYCYATGARGMFRAIDPTDGAAYVYSSFEPSAAQRVFACFDQPDLKAAFTWHATVPVGWRAISNLPAQAEQPHPDGTTTIHFAPSPPMSTYVAVLAAGPFAEIRDQRAERDLGIFCRASMLEHLDADEVFALTHHGMEFYEDRFVQPYPLPKFDYVVAPEYRGAMENFGCVVISERDFVFRSRTTGAERLRRAAMLMHELAHMWFGDLVTMRWWDDLWLNEAFATWASYWCLQEASGHRDPWADFATQHKARGLKADQEAGAHPVYSPVPDVEMAEVSFDDITYRKGASVIKQLAAYVGTEVFVGALRRYFAGHAWGNATFADLVSCLEAESGQSLSRYVQDWLCTAQPSLLRLDQVVDDHGRYAAVRVLQEAPGAEPTLRAHRIEIGVYDSRPEGMVRRASVPVMVSGSGVDVAELIGSERADALLLDHTDLTFARVRFDDATRRTVRASIAEFPDALSRAVGWMSYIDMLQASEIPAREFVAMAAQSLPAEPDSALAGNVLKEAEFAVDYFADPDWVADGRQLLASASLRAIGAAPPGGDHQLMWVRTFCNSARTPGELALMRDWSRGRQTPEGLAIDEELRWLILQSLVAAGAAEPGEVERRFADDTSVNGRYAVSAARAMVPTMSAKEAAWQAALAPGTSVTIRRAILTGFRHPAHRELTAPFAARYFAELPEVWRVQGDEAGRYVAEYGFPATEVAASTVEAAQAWCAAPDRPPPLVKIVTAATTRMRRALAARARDIAERERVRS